jgi:MATE family multidrug resistance protein
MTDRNNNQIRKEIFYLALLMAITQMIAVGSGFISMAMLRSYGNDVIAALALIFSARISIIIIGASILFSLSILVGHANAEKEYRRVGNFVQQGWVLGLLISIPIMFIFWNMGSILIYFGQSQAIATIVQQFFHANIWNVIPFLLSVCNQQFCYGTRKQNIDFLANILSVFVLLISAYILIFGKFGVPELGVVGLGYALDIQGWFYFLFTTAVIYYSKFFKPYELFTFRIHQSWDDLIHMLKMGWPISVQMGGEMLSFFMSAAMVGWLGIKALAAYQVVTQYLFLLFVPVFALSQASSVLIGQAFGNKDYYKIKKLGQTAMIFSFILTLIVAAIFIIFPTRLAALYLNINDAANIPTLHIVTSLFFTIAILQIFDGIRNVLTGSLRGIFDTKYPMLIGFIAIWIIGLPLGYFLAFYTRLGAPGIVIGSTFGIFLGMILLINRWHKKTVSLTKGVIP